MTNIDLGGQIAVVIGGSRGLGRAIAQSLAEAGADLVLTGRDLETLQKAKMELSALGRKIDILQADLFSPDGTEAMCRDVLGKPGSGDRAIAQLKSLSGHRVVFNTAVHVVLSDSGTNEGHLDVTTVHFRRLSDDEIRRYVTRDKPYDSAGGFKVEALGISLFDKIDTHDPTALVGLPLIWLASVLRKHGFTVP